MACLRGGIQVVVMEHFDWARVSVAHRVTSTANGYRRCSYVLKLHMNKSVEIRRLESASDSHGHGVNPSRTDDRVVGSVLTSTTREPRATVRAIELAEWLAHKGSVGRALNCRYTFGGQTKPPVGQYDQYAGCVKVLQGPQQTRSRAIRRVGRRWGMWARC
jgi:hypothetical protein